MKKISLIIAFFIALMVGGDCFAQSKTITVRDVSFEMIFVEGGSFMMGSDSNARGANHDEFPLNLVTLSDYYIGQTEVTQLLWRTVMGSNPSRLKGDHLPVEMVSWRDCQAFIRRLNQLTGLQFALPSEAQWEFAARGGNKSRGYLYSGSNDQDAVAWFKENSGSRPRRVADKQPNELGIYDMSGNVWEWCNDWYNVRSYEDSVRNDPTGFALGNARVFRGGSWRNSSQFLRVAYRNYIEPNKRYNDLGLRLVLIP